MSEPDKTGALDLKAKVLEDETEPKFTELSKQELLKVASTHRWVCARCTLIILFAAGWIGMLAGTVIILVQAPRCPELSPREWWQTGTLYQIDAIEAFQDSDGDGIGDLRGVQQRLDYLEALKVKGLVIGPIHTTEADLLEKTRLTEIDQQYGTLDIFQQLMETAHKKRIRIILDLTPNYKGTNLWFKNATGLSSKVQNTVKEALHFWLKKGVAGIRLGGIDQLEDLQVLAEWKEITAQYSTQGKMRVLFAVTDIDDQMSILEQLNSTSCEFLSSRYLLQALVDRSASRLASRIKEYLDSAQGRWTSWSIGGPNVGHMASVVHQDLARLCTILLFTLPGTPFTTYGDEIGLEDLPSQSIKHWNDTKNFGFSSYALPAEQMALNRNVSVKPSQSIMHWDDTKNFGFSSHALPAEQMALNRNVSVKAQKDDDSSLLSLYKKLSELRQSEISLQHGDFKPLPLPPNSRIFAYMRVWDKNNRILVALNLGTSSAAVALQDQQLPAGVSLVLSSETRHREKAMELQMVELGPHEGLLIKFPSD